MPAYIEAEITGTDGKPHRVRRTLISDYAKRKDCQSTLQIDGGDAKESDLAALGIVLSQPPLAAPVLAQHTLGYLFSARPQDRATYFKKIFEVTDLEELRGAAAALDAGFKLDDDDRQWIRLVAAAAIENAEPILAPLKTAAPAPADLAAAIDGAITATLTAAGHPLPTTTAERLAALEALLLQRRTRTFPVDGFNRQTARRLDRTGPGRMGQARFLPGRTRNGRGGNAPSDRAVQGGVGHPRRRCRDAAHRLPAVRHRRQPDAGAHRPYPHTGAGDCGLRGRRKGCDEHFARLGRVLPCVRSVSRFRLSPLPRHPLKRASAKRVPRGAHSDVAGTGCLCRHRSVAGRSAQSRPRSGDHWHHRLPPYSGSRRLYGESGHPARSATVEDLLQ